jgi:hypothetical protein
MRFKDIKIGDIFLNKGKLRLRKVSAKRARNAEFDSGKFYVNPLERCELYKDEFTLLAEEIIALGKAPT